MCECTNAHALMKVSGNSTRSADIYWTPKCNRACSEISEFNAMRRNTKPKPKSKPKPKPKPMPKQNCSPTDQPLYRSTFHSAHDDKTVANTNVAN